MVVGIFFFYIKLDLPTHPTPYGEKETARLSVFLDGGKIRTFEGPVVKDMTLLETVYFVSQENSLDFRYTIDKNGAVKILSFNKNIDGAGKNWRFYLNSKPVETSGIGSVPINKGDLIEMKYE